MTKEQYGNISGSILAIGRVMGGNVADKGSVSGMLNRAQTVYVRELVFDSRDGFPSPGDPRMLYIATDDNSMYRWDSNSNEYVMLSSESQSVLVGTSEYWDSQLTLLSSQDTVYVYSDRGIKIGDGVTYLYELPFFSISVTEAEKNYWNDKVGARVIDLSTLELYK